MFDAASGRHLGRAHLADEATPAQRRALRRSKEAEKRRLTRALATASRHTRAKYAAVTQATQPKQLGSLSAAQAARHLAEAQLADAAEWALPDLIAPAPPPSHWRTPPTLRSEPASPPPPPKFDSPAKKTGER